MESKVEAVDQTVCALAYADIATLLPPKLGVVDKTTVDTVSTSESVTSEDSVCDGDDDWVQQAVTEAEVVCDNEEAEVPRQLGPGLFPPANSAEHPAEENKTVDVPGPGQVLPGPPPPPPMSTVAHAPSQPVSDESPATPAEETDVEPDTRPEAPFAPEETLFIFDWDDTILPSTWLQQQGLRLDAGSQPNSQHREVLREVASIASKTLSAARRHGTVILVTNAERGWIELSCQKFLPVLFPLLEGIKIVSARTSYEGPKCSAPHQWKLRAFAVEITSHYGSDVLGDTAARKNTLSLGDSLHEREALMVATQSLPNCRTKALKFVERPELSQICKQHELVVDCFERIVHHDGDLDLCIRCP